MMNKLVLSAFLLLSLEKASSFQSFKLPNFFGNPWSDAPQIGTQTNPLEQKKLDLFNAISFTNNGKDATLQQQTRVLKMVREIELSQPPSPTLLTDIDEAKALLDGTWYLQYTSASEIDNDDISENDYDLNDADIWKVENSEEKITTKQSKMKGSVTAGGFNVDTSNRPVKQIIDIDNMIVTNEVQANFGFVKVGGPFRPSEKVANRVVVSFTEGEIQFNFGLTLKLDWIFSMRAFFAGTADNGWLEVSYVGDNLRIGRGNKGNMFILTRDPDAVQP